MNLYVDSSALMRRYLNRPGAAETDLLLDEAGYVATAAVTRVEVAAVVHRLRAGGVLSDAELQRALAALDDDLAHFAKVSISQEVLDEAYRICCVQRLKGYDAVHLGAASVWRAMLKEPVTVATFDDQLWNAAAAEGLEVWPNNLGDFKTGSASRATAGVSTTSDETGVTE